MIVRQGSKNSFAEKIIKFFPKHDIFIEPFFGAGGMFFNKKPSKFNYLNDLDKGIYNLFKCLKYRKDEFLELLENTIIHKQFFEDFKNYKVCEDELEYAFQYYYISNLSFMGGGSTLRMGNSNYKEVWNKNLNEYISFIKKTNAIFSNEEFDKFLIDYSIRDETERNRLFVYADPPYLDTSDANYNTRKWKEKDTEKLFDVLVNTIKSKFAISEFESPKIIELVKKYNLNYVIINERFNLGSPKNEILIYNYKLPNQKELF